MANEIEIDLKEFNKWFTKVNKLTDKTTEEVLNTKAMFIARNAVQFTLRAKAAEIRSTLKQIVKGTTGTLASVLIAKDRKNRGLPYLNPEQMKVEEEKLIRARIRGIKFLLSGWIPGIKRLLSYSSSKSVPSNLKISGKPKGGAFPAIIKNGVANAVIWNEVQGGQHPSAKVQEIIEAGLHLGIRKEITNMVKYFEKELDKAYRTLG